MNKKDLIKHINESLEKDLIDNLEYNNPSISGYYIGTLSVGGRIEDNLKIEINVKVKSQSELRWSKKEIK